MGILGVVRTLKGRKPRPGTAGGGQSGEEFWQTGGGGPAHGAFAL
jgi:hypothetical protein